MEVTPPLFERAEPYTATIAIGDIAIPESVGRSRTKRSIEIFGQLTLPLLRELYPSDSAPLEGPYFEVIDGQRRIADLVELNPDGYVEAKVLPHSVNRATAAAMAVSLNFNRAPNPVHEADHFDYLRSQGYDLEDIAALLGISRSKVDRRIALIDKLQPELITEVRKGNLAVGVAEQLSRLSANTQKALIAKLESGEIRRITAEDVTEQLRVIRSGMVPQTMFPQQAADHKRALRTQLHEMKSEGLTRDEALALIDEVFADAG